MFDDLRETKLWRWAAQALLALDAFVDSSLYAAGAWTQQSYAAFSAFMDRFHIAGFRRVLTELASEALTLGIGAGLVALTLAIPAFQETSDDWLKKAGPRRDLSRPLRPGSRPARHQAR